MLNIPVQAAAEGLPMLNRRRLLKGSVAGAIIAVPVAAAEARTDLTNEQQFDACIVQLRSILSKMQPWDRARRLANALSHVLTSTDGGRWYATIYPADRHAHSVMFGDIDSAEYMRSCVDDRLIKLIGVYRAARARLSETCVETDAVALGREPSKAAVRRNDKAHQAEEKAFLDICAFRPMNNVTGIAKAEFLMEFTAHSCLNEEQVEALLGSMAGRD